MKKTAKMHEKLKISKKLKEIYFKKLNWKKNPYKKYCCYKLTFN